MNPAVQMDSLNAQHLTTSCIDDITQLEGKTESSTQNAEKEVGLKS